MPVIEVITSIAAPVERAFDLARCIALHERSMARHRESAVGDGPGGLIGEGESVTWAARHFGVRQRLTARITGYDRPRWFRDSMVSGAFARFDHDHYFEPSGTGTLMVDRFDYRAPLGALGMLADAIVLKRYMRRLLEERNAVVRRVAESEEWRGYLPGDAEQG